MKKLVKRFNSYLDPCERRQLMNKMNWNFFQVLKFCAGPETWLHNMITQNVPALKHGYTT